MRARQARARAGRHDFQRPDELAIHQWTGDGVGFGALFRRKQAERFKRRGKKLERVPPAAASDNDARPL